MAQGQVVGALVAGQVQFIAQQAEGVGVHAGRQTGAVQFARVKKGHQLPPVVYAFGQVVDNFAQLINLLALWVSPAPALDAIAAAHVVLPVAIVVGQPGGIFIGVGVPGIAPQGAELSRALISAQISQHLGDGRFPKQLLSHTQLE